MKKEKKSYIYLFTYLTLLTLLVISFKYISLNTTSANPDYICKKSIYNSSCRIMNYPTSCSNWNISTHSRTCSWVKTREVSYYLISTDCESWYTKVLSWWDVSWTSLNKYSEYVSRTENCTIIEYDSIAPSWRLK